MINHSRLQGRLTAWLGTVFLLTLSVVLPVEAQDEAVFRGEAYRTALVSVSVRRLPAGIVCFALNAETSLTQASVTKLIPTAAALETIGENTCFETALSAEGGVSQGILNGNLWILPGGDPSLGSEHLKASQTAFLDEWVMAVKAAGIRRITGDICVRDRYLFDAPGVSPQWTWEDVGNYYAAGLSDVTLFDNTVKVSLQSGRPGSKAVVTDVWPATPRPFLDKVEVRAAANQKDSAYFYGDPSAAARSLYGSIPAGRERFVVKADLPEPGRELAFLLHRALEQAGIEVEGSERVVDSNELGDRAKALANRVFYVYRSPVLSDLIRITNVKSHNLMAEGLGRQAALALNPAIRPVSETETTAALKAYWQDRGVDTDSWFLNDVCGLSPLTALSTASVSDLLVKMYGNRAFVESLPRAGKEGTVARFGTQLPGPCRVKSGSMQGVRAYAGYYTAPSGITYAFDVAVNRALCPASDIARDVERFLISLP